MDIDGQVRRTRNDEKMAAANAATQETHVAAAVTELRGAFREFRDALVRHGVPPLRIIRLEREKMPFVRQIFSSGTSRLRAMPVGLGWRFHGNLLLTDGAIAGLSYGKAGIGRKVVPEGNGNEWFSRQVLDALARAGLGKDFSDEHFYMEHDGPLALLDWSKVHGNPVPGGVRIRISSDSYVLRGGQLFIQVPDGGVNGNDVDVPLIKDIARYITAGGS